MRILIPLLTLIFTCTAVASAQLPFYTDDADTTEKGKFHLEIYNEHDILQRGAYPAKRQNTLVFTLNYGVTKKLEVGVNAPVITLSSSRTATHRTVTGQGDTQVGVKYNLVDEREGSRMPALSAVFYVEAPTGEVKKQLGSGLVDYYLYGIVQKSVTKKTKLRLNGGVLFSGNSSTGLIGVQAERGQVFTGNISLVRDFTDRLKLGVEIFGALSTRESLSRGQLSTQLGGNFNFTEKFALSFGILAGRFTASPRAGAHLGFSYDF
ncbi:MAG: hypothetical protein DMF69_18625 [Acidobacteria bacterium]|nr:MAG: hypothetical protein DMF69_18625 [Acidobacteriota bacterium]